MLARLLAYYGHTMRKQGSLFGERDNARNNARSTQARKATHGLDGQHQDVDRTLRGRVSQNDRGQRRDIWRKYVHRVHGQPALGSRTPNRTYKPRRYVRSGSACGGRGNGFPVAERLTVVVH